MPSLIHRGFALLLLCVVFASGLRAASGTITFNDTIPGGSYIVTDGQGGSVDIAGVELRIYVTNAGGNQIASGSPAFRCINDAELFPLPMLVWAPDPPDDYSAFGMTIKSADGTLFKLSSLDFSGAATGDFSIDAYRGGVLKGTQSFVVADSSIPVTLNQGGG